MIEVFGQITAGIAIPSLMLLFMLVLLTYVLLMAQRRPDFDIAQVLKDDQGKLSAMRAFAFVALGVSCWVIATLTLKGTLTPDYFLYFLVCWANTPVAMVLAQRWDGSLPMGRGAPSSPPASPVLLQSLGQIPDPLQKPSKTPPFPPKVEVDGDDVPSGAKPK